VHRQSITLLSQYSELQHKWNVLHSTVLWW
jgi:hypothetical protein